MISIDNTYLLKDVTAHPSPPADSIPSAQELEAWCKQNHAIGIAANQIGYAAPWVYVTAGLGFATSSAVGMIIHRPEYRPIGDKQVTATEGCLSLPGREFIVRRPQTIAATWYNSSGKCIKRPLSGMAARVFMHEADHLKGLTLEATSVYEKE